MSKEIPEPNIYKNINGEILAFPNPEYEMWKSKKLYDIYIKESGIPEFYHNIEFSDYKGTLSLSDVKKIKYIAQNINSNKFEDIYMYLYSEKNNSQKTAVACNFGKECIKQGKRVKFALFGDIVEALQKTSGFTTDYNYENYLKDIIGADIIILDDAFDKKKMLTYAKSNDMILSTIDRFLRNLFGKQKVIVFTSNIPIEVLENEDRLGVSLYKLLDRNITPEFRFHLRDDITIERKSRLFNIFDDECWTEVEL